MIGSVIEFIDRGFISDPRGYEPDDQPVPVGACSVCGALVALDDQRLHRRWHELIISTGRT